MRDEMRYAMRDEMRSTEFAPPPVGVVREIFLPTFKLPKKGLLIIMKRLALLFFFAAAWFMFSAPAAMADNGPHIRGTVALTDSCAGCHRLHTAKAVALTMDAQPALCYTCHGATATGSALNVRDGLGYSDSTRVTLSGPLRGGGFENARINSAAPTGQQTTPTLQAGTPGTVPVLAAAAVVTSTHSMDGTSLKTWGNGAAGGADTAIALRCTTCHDPHGNGNFRILRPIPNGSGGNSTPILDVATKTYTTANYWKVDDVAGNAANFITNVSAWCSTCHTRYLAPTGSGSTPLAGEAVYTYRHRTDATATATPTCIQCHVSHGSNAAMGTRSVGVLTPDGLAIGPATGTIAGNSKLLRIDSRGTCQMCHLR